MPYVTIFSRLETVEENREVRFDGLPPEGAPGRMADELVGDADWYEESRCYCAEVLLLLLLVLLAVLLTFELLALAVAVVLVRGRVFCSAEEVADDD